MLLRNRFYLSDFSGAGDDHTASEPQPRSGLLKPLWILPRTWCVTTSLNAKGVPRHKTAAFVKLHLTRLAPFADYGVYACRSGDWVHLWFWENQRVRDLCKKCDVEFATLQLAPESVCFPKAREGTVLYQCIHGVEAQLWHQGLLLDSAWWPEMIDTAAWQAWRPTAVSSSGIRTQSASWPEFPPAINTLTTNPDPRSTTQLFEPWGGNLLGEQWWHFVKEIRTDMIYVAAVGILLGVTGYLSAQWWSLQNIQGSMEKKISALSSQVDPLNKARSKALEQQQWVAQLVKLRNQDNVSQFLKSLQPVLQKQEATLREFEYLDGEIRLLLVPVNTELNIVSLTQDLETLPQLTTLRLLPESDARVMRISGKIRPFPEVKVLGQLQTPANSVAIPYRSGKREKGE